MKLPADKFGDWENAGFAPEERLRKCLAAKFPTDSCFAPLWPSHRAFGRAQAEILHPASLYLHLCRYPLEQMDVLQEAFLDKLKAIDGISTVETQTYTLEEAPEELLCLCAFAAFPFIKATITGLSYQRAHNAGGSDLGMHDISLCACRECTAWVKTHIICSITSYHGDTTSHHTRVGMSGAWGVSPSDLWLPAKLLSRASFGSLKYKTCPKDARRMLGVLGDCVTYGEDDGVASQFVSKRRPAIPRDNISFNSVAKTAEELEVGKAAGFACSKTSCLRDACCGELEIIVLNVSAFGDLPVASFWAQVGSSLRDLPLPSNHAGDHQVREAAWPPIYIQAVAQVFDHPISCLKV